MHLSQDVDGCTKRQGSWGEHRVGGSLGEAGRQGLGVSEHIPITGWGQHRHDGASSGGARGSGVRGRSQGQREQLRTRGHRVPLDPHRSTAWDTGTPRPPEEGPEGLHTHCTGSCARVACPEALSKWGRCCDAAPTPCQEWASTGASACANWLQFSSVSQSCPTLCDPMDCSTPGLPVHHQLPELAQIHVHRVSDAIQPSHPLSSPSPAFNLSQHQGLSQ